MLISQSTYRITLAVLAAAFLSGCHSAMFQTAKIRDGMEASAGLTRVHGADTQDISDYSIYMRGEMGHAASKSKFGYSFALSFVSPFKDRGDYGQFIDYGADESGTFPNESVGVLPEFKLQFPRKIPVDMALDVRLNGVYPERAALMVSADLATWLTPYASYGLTGTEGRLLSLGTEVVLSDRVSLLIERTQWLSEHEYPNDYDRPARRNPYSVGLAMSYRFPRKATSEKYDPRDLAFHKAGVRYRIVNSQSGT